jgi:hypothetical protein
MSKNENRIQICNWCGWPNVIIWVHRHGQCSVCGINIDECCRGEEINLHVSSKIKKEKDRIKND